MVFSSDAVAHMAHSLLGDAVFVPADGHRADLKGVLRLVTTRGPGMGTDYEEIEGIVKRMHHDTEYRNLMDAAPPPMGRDVRLDEIRNELKDVKIPAMEIAYLARNGDDPPSAALISSLVIPVYNELCEAFNLREVSRLVRLLDAHPGLDVLCQTMERFKVLEIGGRRLLPEEVPMAKKLRVVTACVLLIMRVVTQFYERVIVDQAFRGQRDDAGSPNKGQILYADWGLPPSRLNLTKSVLECMSCGASIRRSFLVPNGSMLTAPEDVTCAVCALADPDTSEFLDDTRFMNYVLARVDLGKVLRDKGGHWNEVHDPEAEALVLAGLALAPEEDRAFGLKQLIASTRMDRPRELRMVAPAGLNTRPNMTELVLSLELDMALLFQRTVGVESRRQLIVELYGFCFDQICGHGRGDPLEKAQMLARQRCQCTDPAKTQHTLRENLKKKFGKKKILDVMQEGKSPKMAEQLARKRVRVLLRWAAAVDYVPQIYQEPALKEPLERRVKVPRHVTLSPQKKADKCARRKEGHALQRAAVKHLVGLPQDEDGTEIDTESAIACCWGMMSPVLVKKLNVQLVPENANGRARMNFLLQHMEARQRGEWLEDTYNTLERFREGVLQWGSPLVQARLPRPATDGESAQAGLTAEAGSGVYKTPDAHILSVFAKPVATVGTVLGVGYYLYIWVMGVQIADKVRVHVEDATLVSFAEVEGVMRVTGGAVRNMISGTTELYDWSLMWVKIVVSVIGISVVTRVWMGIPLVPAWIGYLARLSLGKQTAKEQMLAIHHLGREHRDNVDGDGPAPKPVPLQPKLNTSKIVRRQSDPGLLLAMENESSSGTTQPTEPSEFDAWELYAAHGDRTSDWTALVGKRVALRYAKGQRQGKMRLVRVTSAGPGVIRCREIDGTKRAYHCASATDVRLDPSFDQPGFANAMSGASPRSPNSPMRSSAGEDGVEEEKGVEQVIRCYPWPGDPGYLPIQILFYPHIVLALSTLMVQTKRNIDIACYTIDNYFLVTMEQCLDRGIHVRIVVDMSQITNPSGAYQITALQKLMECGAHVRTRKPQAAYYSIQHEKSWMFDNRIVATGSMNLTTNSATHCEENVCITREVSTVKAFRAHYVWIFDDARDVTMDELELAQQKRSQSRGRSSSMVRKSTARSSDDCEGSKNLA